MHDEGLAQDVRSIEESIAWLMRRAAQKPLHRHIAAAGVALDRAAYLAVAKVAKEGPLRLSDLAERLGLTVSTTSRHVRQLERLGLVRREPEPGDRRAAILYVTPAGEAVCERVRAARRQALTKVLADWPPQDRHQLAVLLARFTETLERGVGSPSSPDSENEESS